jgi:hypothetical protein
MTDIIVYELVIENIMLFHYPSIKPKDLPAGKLL